MEQREKDALITAVHNATGRKMTIDEADSVLFELKDKNIRLINTISLLPLIGGLNEAMRKLHNWEYDLMGG